MDQTTTQQTTEPCLPSLSTFLRPRDGGDGGGVRVCRGTKRSRSGVVMRGSLDQHRPTTLDTHRNHVVRVHVQNGVVQASHARPYFGLAVVEVGDLKGQHFGILVGIFLES